MSQSHGSQDHIIFSTYQAGLSDGFNQGSHEIARLILEGMGIDYIECDGVYLGEAERSFIVSSEYEEQVQRLCQVYNQECYLLATTHMHGMRNAHFVYPDGSQEFMGYLRSVSRDRAMREEGYTYRPDIDTYFIIADTDETNMGELQRMGWYDA